MSNIDKQALREEVQEWKEIYCEPADAENLKFFMNVEALLDELEAAEKLTDEQREIMRQAASDISYAIFNLTGSDLSRLKPGVVESTDPTDTALIAERSLRAAAGKGE